MEKHRGGKRWPALATGDTQERFERLFCLKRSFSFVAHSFRAWLLPFRLSHWRQTLS
jgi:hypothetical protein